MSAVRAIFAGLDPYKLTGVRVTDRVLGSGANATVLELEYMGLKCAGKKIYEKLLDTKQGDASYPVHRFEEECRLLSQVRHPNIVQFLGVYFQQGVRVPILVMEFLPENLTSYIEQHNLLELPKDISYSILHDVALGLCYLHGQAPPIIHRDLTSNNVLLTPSMTAKISDLGVARILNLTPLQVSRMTQTPGTPAYMPPEVMVANPMYNTSIDEFSYGILMIHMFSGRWPLPHVGPSRIEGGKLKAVTEAERREVYLQAIGDDHPLKNLILKCIHNDPQERPHATEIAGRLSGMVLQFPTFFADRLEEALRQLERMTRENEDLREVYGKIFEALDQENRDLRDENRVLKQENRDLQKKNSDLSEENGCPRIENGDQREEASQHMSVRSDSDSGKLDEAQGISTSCTWDSLIEQLQAKIDPKDREGWDKIIGGANKIRILAIGATGVGKSTLINELTGSCVLTIGRQSFTPLVTTSTEIHHIKGVDIIVYDFPGLHCGLHPDQEKKYIQEMIETIRAHDGVDLILYCRKMTKMNASIENEKDIIKKLTESLGTLEDDHGKGIGKDIWRRALFVITFANVYYEELMIQQQSKQESTIETLFKINIEQWKKFYKKVLNGCGIYVPVSVCPASYRDQKLCTTEHWLSEFWAAAFEAMTERGALALLRVNHHRLLQSYDSENLADQPITLTNKVRRGLLSKMPGVRSLPEAAEISTGAKIGAIAAAVSVGVLLNPTMGLITWLVIRGTEKGTMQDAIMPTSQSTVYTYMHFVIIVRLIFIML